MPLSWMRRNGGMSQALSPCTLCIKAPWISGRLWICAVMPSRFMRSSCASLTWSRCENDQRQQQPAHLCEILGLGVALDPQQLGGDRREHRLAPADIVEVVVALERL